MRCKKNQKKPVSKKNIGNLKIEIIRPAMHEECLRSKKDYHWKEISDILYEIQRQTRMLFNKSISLNWRWTLDTKDYKEKYGIYPDMEKTLGYKKMQSYCYNQLKDRAILATSNLSAIMQIASNKWGNDRQAVFCGEKNPPNYKKDIPIEIAKPSLSLYKQNGKYFVSLSLINRTYQKEKELPSTMFDFLVNVRDRQKKLIFDRMLIGEYTHLNAKLVHQGQGKNKKWFIIITYEFPKSVITFNKENILGIDMGVCYPIYGAINNSPKRMYIQGGEIENFRKGIEARRISYLKQGKFCGEGRRGHGRATRIQPIDKLTERTSNFRKSCNAKYAKAVVDFAVKNNCGTIQIENLKGIKHNGQQESFLSYWTYFDIQQQIAYRAKNVNIKVIKINPKYTSQRCSQCGAIHKESRNKRTFTCVQCGYTEHADYNAAKNISTPNIAKIILKELQKERKIDLKKFSKFSKKQKYILHSQKQKRIVSFWENKEQKVS